MDKQINQKTIKSAHSLSKKPIIQTKEQDKDLGILSITKANRFFIYITGNKMMNNVPNVFPPHNPPIQFLKLILVSNDTAIPFYNSFIAWKLSNLIFPY